MIVEVRDLSLYDRLGDVNTFFRDYKRRVPQCQRLLALDQALRATPTRWWGAHKKNIGDWKKCRRLMWISFGQVEANLIDRYDGQNDPIDHKQLCMEPWREIPQEEWVLASSVSWRQLLRVGIWKPNFDMVLLARHKWLMDL